MKRYILLIALSIFSLNAIHAEITWTLSDDGTLTISGTDMPNYSSGQVPWYSQKDKIKKIIIKNGVTNIGSYAFNGCSVLTSLTIPNSVTSIGSKALDGTKWYDNQPDGVVYAGKVLYKYKGTMPSNTKIDIKEGTTGIAASAFNGCSDLTSLTIPNSVTNIGGSALRGCSGLTSITIPNSVTSIGYSVFSSCSGLTSITIPNSVTSIGGSAFSGCSGITSIIIPNSVTSIGELAFKGCSGITSIIIPNSVTSIGGSAFSGCSVLTSIIIPNSVTSIGESAFKGCSGITSIIIPNSVTSIGKSVFSGCSGLTSVTIGMKHIGDAFSGLSNLTNVTILDGVESIGTYAFSDCLGLTTITIPNSVTSIGESAFYRTKWYDNQPDGLVYAGKVLYRYKGTMPSNTKIDIKDGTKAIVNYAFRKCTGLTSVIIPNSVTSIGLYAFEGCSGLTSITIPNSVTSIGGSAFYGCSGLTSITIPNSVTSIGTSAFYGCSGLTSITIPESVTSIGNGAFDGAKLRNIVIKAKTPPTSGENTFSGQSYYHTTLMIPEGCWDAYAYDNYWYKFINIREMTYNAVNLTNSKAYMLKSSNEGSYLFYDSVNDCVASLNETALDDTEENITWMTTEVDGKHYVYNLGAKKFLVADKTNAKTGYRLSDVPVSIDIEDGKDAIVLGKSKEFYMVINDKLNVDEGLESQIIATTGIKGVSVEANKPTVTYNVNGQIVPNDTKGLHIKNGKKVVIK